MGCPVAIPRDWDTGWSLAMATAAVRARENGHNAGDSRGLALVPFHAMFHACLGALVLVLVPALVLLLVLLTACLPASAAMVRCSSGGTYALMHLRLPEWRTAPEPFIARALATAGPVWAITASAEGSHWLATPPACSAPPKLLHRPQSHLID